MLGGYKLVDFRNAELECGGEAVVIRKIYNRCRSIFVKRFVACNLMIDGADYSETDMTLHLDDDDNYIAEVGPYIFTITPDDEVSVIAASGGVASVNGKTGVVELDADDIPVHNTQSVQENLERIDSEIEDLIDNKQDKLTAGQNITIVNNVISATGGSGSEYVGDNPIDIWEDGSGDKHIQWVAQQGYNIYFDRSAGGNLRLDARPTNVFEISISGSVVSLENSKTVEDIAEAFSHYGVIELRKIDGLYIEKIYHLDRFAPQGTVVFSTITEDTANTTLLEVITFYTRTTPMSSCTTGTIKTKTISF